MPNKFVAVYFKPELYFSKGCSDRWYVFSLSPDGDKVAILAVFVLGIATPRIIPRSTFTLSAASRYQNNLPVCEMVKGNLCMTL